MMRRFLLFGKGYGGGERGGERVEIFLICYALVKGSAVVVDRHNVVDRQNVFYTRSHRSLTVGGGAGRGRERGEWCGCFACYVVEQ